jgi:hypothetical protein
MVNEGRIEPLILLTKIALCANMSETTAS